MEFRPDFSEVSIEVPAGTYGAKIIGFENRHGKESGAPYIRWALRLTDNEFGGTDIFHNTPLSGKGARFLIKFLRALTSDYHEGPFNAADYIGKSLVVTLGYALFPDGTPNPYPKVVDVMAYPNSPSPQVPQEPSHEQP